MTIPNWRLLLVLGLCVPGFGFTVNNNAAASRDLGGYQETTPAANAQQATSEAKPQPAQTNTSKETPKKKLKIPGAIVIAPIPISNPAIGNGVVLGAGYIFQLNKNDKVSPPSVFGGAWMATNNGSGIYGVGGQFYFKENTYNTSAFYGRGNLNYDLYGPGVFTGLKLPLNQEGQAFKAEFLRRVGWQFFVGPRFLMGNSFITVRPTDTSLPPLPPDLGLHTNLVALGAKVIRDTSVNRFYPTNGTIFTFTSDFFSQSLGSKYTFQSYKANFNKYWSWGENQVLVYNAYACSVGGTPPFYGNCIYGTGSELRGYVAGKYFDRHMLATQLEYRQYLKFHLGLVAFGGVGEAIPGKDQLLFRNNRFLPSGGLGLRVLVSKKYHVNLRGDLAYGADGHTFTMGVGEAF